MGLHTMYEAERRVTLPSHTNDGGEISVPYLDWFPGQTLHPCEATLPDRNANDDTTRIPCGHPASDDVHAKLESGTHHEYIASSPQPGMYLVLDDRLGFTIPLGATVDEAAALVEFVANAIAIGAGYPSIYYTRRRLPFRG